MLPLLAKHCALCPQNDSQRILQVPLARTTIPGHIPPKTRSARRQPIPHNAPHRNPSEKESARHNQPRPSRRIPIEQMSYRHRRSAAFQSRHYGLIIYPVRSAPHIPPQAPQGEYGSNQSRLLPGPSIYSRASHPFLAAHQTQFSYHATDYRFLRSHSHNQSLHSTIGQGSCPPRLTSLRSGLTAGAPGESSYILAWRSTTLWKTGPPLYSSRAWLGFWWFGGGQGQHRFTSIIHFLGFSWS